LLDEHFGFRIGKADAEALRYLKALWGLSEADCLRLLIRDARRRYVDGPPVLEALARPGQDGGMNDERKDLAN